MVSSPPLRDSVHQFSKAALRPLSRVLRNKATRYCYAPLNESAKQIRILTLLPGKFSAKIQVGLKIVQLIKECVPGFEALSYCWGSAEDPAEILIKAKHGSQVLAVTENLAEALRYLRYESQPRILWVDAICIDQQNFQERNSQVKRMADIYTLSRRVVVWLGPEYNDSSLALNLLDSLGSKLQVDWVSGRMKVTCEVKSEQHWADQNEVLPYKECEISALVSIFDRPWFERLWIWQEIWMAGPSAILLCGKTTSLWTNFRNAFFCITNKRWISVELISLARRHVISMLCQQSEDRSFPRVVEGTRYSKCTDPRDRIFALLSLLNPQDPVAAIEPDYNKDVTEIYMEVFLGYCQKLRHLRLMQSCEFSHEASGFPTWLPNWSMRKYTNSIFRANASGRSAAVLEAIEKGRIRVCGIAVRTLDSIAHHSIWDSAVAGYTIRDFALEIRGIAHKLTVRDAELGTFCNILCCGAFAEEVYPQSTALPNQPSLRQSIAYVSSIAKTLHFDEAHLSADFQKFVKMAAYMTRGRLVYRTSDGILGVAPTSAEPGDVVVVMFGSRSPMVLRPTHDNTYKVIGESYCYGYMSCEGLLGLLPDTHKIVRLMDKKNRTLHESYLELASGVVQCEDPRLGKLPQGWKLGDHDRMHLQPLFVNEETGEDTWYDPRLTPEALKARGVDVEYFDLI